MLRFIAIGKSADWSMVRRAGQEEVYNPSVLTENLTHRIPVREFDGDRPGSLSSDNPWHTSET